MLLLRARVARGPGVGCGGSLPRRPPPRKGGPGAGAHRTRTGTVREVPGGRDERQREDEGGDSAAPPETPRRCRPALLDQRPALVRLTLADGRRLDVEHPSVRGDTLFGDTTVYQSRDRADTYPVAVPFALVRSASVRRFAAGRSVALVLGLTVVIVVIAEARPPEPVTVVRNSSGGEGCAGM